MAFAILIQTSTNKMFTRIIANNLFTVKRVCKHFVYNHNRRTYCYGLYKAII